MSQYPPELLEIVGDPDSWQLSKVGDSGARVFHLPALNAWLKCAASGVRAEAEALRYLQDKALVPRVVHYQEENGVQYLVTSSLPGCPLTDSAMLACPDKLIDILADALHQLHNVDVPSCPLNQCLAVKLRTWDFVSEERAWLEANRPDEDLVFTHGDACLPNFCSEAGRYSGCLDLADAGVADRWQDLSLSLWSLQYNLGTTKWARRFLDAYGIQPDQRMIEYYLRLNQMDAAVM